VSEEEKKNKGEGGVKTREEEKKQGRKRKKTREEEKYSEEEQCWEIHEV
jgi:hypothetical protein